MQAAQMAHQHVRDIVSPHARAGQNGVLNRWVKYLRNEAQVVVLNVPDDVDAYLLFETLNDRGLKASQADLLKNYLISQTKNGRMAEAQHKWAQMTGILESLGQDDVTVVYLHHLLITRLGHTKSQEIFAKVKETVKGQTQALKFLDEAAEGANDYHALFNPSHPKWNEYGMATRHHITTINRDLRVQQIRPLMFAVARRFSVKEAKKAFELFVYWSVRFLIYGGRGGLLDRNYAIAAHEVGKGAVKTAKELTDMLAGIIPSDAAFQTAFSEARVALSPLARYYLRALEKKYKGEDEPEWVPEDDETVINLEHILPENPRDGWAHIPADVASAYYKRLGNMVLLQAKDNSIVGNAAFDKKKPILAASPYEFTRIAGQQKKWGTQEIEKRQAKLAEWAVKTWPIRIK